MKASYNWLRALLPQLSASASEVAERITRAGLEVEQLVPFGAGLVPVIVAQVRKIEPHPGRATLRLVTVDRGAGVEQRLVCGAPNVPDPGGLVVLAPLGTSLPAKGLTLTSREIGGIVSEGMLCSEEELGLAAVGAGEKADKGGGIMIVTDPMAPGTPFLKAFPGASDTIFEIGLTPNRPDALGHVGIARDLAALFDIPFLPPGPLAPVRVGTRGAPSLISVLVQDHERCPHYGAAVVTDVQVGPSPPWLRFRLASLGIRSISNIVDITNLVMFELGHPMHAFDLDRVRGGQIVVRAAHAGESLRTLDGVDRALDSDDLVIADRDGASALAGVMGGGLSEVTAATKSVLLECAYFTPRGVRRSARRHGLHTEASHRFERGVDPAAVPMVLAHAASLMTELARGAAAPGIVYASRGADPIRHIPLRSRRIDALLGMPVPFSQALATLGRLGFPTVRAAEGDAATVEIPTFRPDISREVDLIEEVSRIQGLDAIPARVPSIRPQPPRLTGRFTVAAREQAVALGLSEAVLYGFVAPAHLQALGAPEPVVRVANPLTEERSVMRTSLLPGLLESIGRAFRHGQPDARLFAIGPVFLRRAVDTPTGPEADRSDESQLPDEVPSFAAVVAGERPGHLSKRVDYDVFDAKGIALEMVARVIRRAADVRPFAEGKRPRHLHPRTAAELVVGDSIVGQIGTLHPDTLLAFDLRNRPVALVEIDLRALAALGRQPTVFRPIPRVPAASRDLALVVHDDVSAGEVARALRETAGDLCERLELFDLFRGGSIPPDHRSLAFRVVYRDPKGVLTPAEARTLTDQEVDTRHALVVLAAQSRFNAALRS